MLIDILTQSVLPFFFFLLFIFSHFPPQSCFLPFFCQSLGSFSAALSCDIHTYFPSPLLPLSRSIRLCVCQSERCGLKLSHRPAGSPILPLSSSVTHFPPLLFPSSSLQLLSQLRAEAFLLSFLLLLPLFSLCCVFSSALSWVSLIQMGVTDIEYI